MTSKTDISALSYKALVKCGVITPAKCEACGAVLKPSKVNVIDTRINHALKYSKLVRLRSKKCDNNQVCVSYWSGSFEGRLINPGDCENLHSFSGYFIYYPTFAKNLRWLCLKNCSEICKELSNIHSRLTRTAMSFDVFTKWNMRANFKNSINIYSNSGNNIVTDACAELTPSVYRALWGSKVDALHAKSKSSNSYPYNESYYNPLAHNVGDKSDSGEKNEENSTC